MILCTSFMWGSVTSQKWLNEFNGQALMIHIHLSAFFKIPCWVEGFLDCSLCCSTPLFWAESWKFLLGILELTRRYLSLHIPRLAVGVQHAIKLLPVILVSKREDSALYYLCLYWYVLASINRLHTHCFHVASQSIRHLRWLQVITSSLYAVCLARLLKLDTLSPFFYYELLVLLITLAFG